MIKHVYVLALALILSISAKAAPGDTTWVDATNAQLSWFGSYDSTVVFPHGKTFRSIYMIFTLGKYMCSGYDPAHAGTGTGGTGWCGDWDYTVLNYVITPNGDSYELGRFITPYANALNPRTPWSATQTYVYDVTDYAPVLHDTAKIRIAFSGYSGGFTGKIRFAFIEGAPDRDVTGIKRIWTGSYGYGGTPDINSHFTPAILTAPEYTQSATFKFIVTGHGSDANGCCEFMSHNYQVVLNNSIIADQPIWRSDCGSNELYPQSGTWIFERGNWCPGAQVRDNFHNIPGIVAGSTFRLGLQFDPYTGGGSYSTEGILFYYGAMKKILDASIDDIIAPTSDDNHFRENPICGSPVISVKNRGRSTINTITFQYGIKGAAMQTYKWTGSLATFESKEITLPGVTGLNNIAGDTLTHGFIAKILTVNGAYDADSTNNVASSTFLSAPYWPNKFKVVMFTNNEGIATGSSTSESSWIIYDKNSNIVAQRTNNVITKLYTDTVKLPTGFYKMVVYDSSCDGLNWWLFPQMGITPGYINVKKMNNVLIPMKGFNYSGTYNNDYGCGHTQYFYTVDSTAGITNINEGDMVMDVYPNPAQNIVNVEIGGVDNLNGRIQIIDALGRVVTDIKSTSVHQQLDTHNLVSGLYTIVFFNEATGNKLTSRLLIAK